MCERAQFAINQGWPRKVRVFEEAQEPGKLDACGVDDFDCCSAAGCI